MRRLRQIIRRLVLPPRSQDPRENQQIEICLSIARLLLASASVLAILLDPPAALDRLASDLIYAYVPYSAAILALLIIRKSASPSKRLQIILCAADIAFIGAISGAQEPTTPFFGFLTFVLVSAAFRWGFLETVITGLLLWVAIQAVALLWGTHDLFRLVIRTAYVVTMSVLLGYLARWDKRLKAERSLIGRAMSRARPGLSLSNTIEGVFDEILSFYDASAAILPALDQSSGRAYWIECKGAASGMQRVRISEMQPPDQEAYLFATPAHAWHWSLSPNHGQQTFAVDEAGVHLPEVAIRLDKRCIERHELETLLAINVSFGEELTGRVYLLNPQLRGTRRTEVAFVQRFIQQLQPVIYAVYLWRQLRSKVGGIERAQIARALHDGVLQSLAVLDLSIAQLRSDTDEARREVRAGEVQNLVRNEINALRELTNQLRSANIRPGELVPYLVDMVERFARESRIEARLASDSEDVILPPRVCRNILGIVQEALANVRKHSGAKKVLVRFNCERSVWTLVIDDDGCGFDFSGALSFVELEHARKGPVTIKERVRLLKGDLIIESTPGAGCRIFISGSARP